MAEEEDGNLAQGHAQRGQSVGQSWSHNKGMSFPALLDTDEPAYQPIPLLNPSLEDVKEVAMSMKSDQRTKLPLLAFFLAVLSWILTSGLKTGHKSSYSQPSVFILSQYTRTFDTSSPAFLHLPFAAPLKNHLRPHQAGGQ